MGKGHRARLLVAAAPVILAATSCGARSGGGWIAHGIGTDWKWTAGVEPQVSAPYQPCGTVGTGPVSWVAADPTKDEIAVASRGGLVTFFALDGTRTSAFFEAGGPVSSVDYAADGRTLVVAGDTGVKLVDAASKAVVTTVEPFRYRALAAGLSPDGALLAVQGWDEQPAGFPASKILRLVRVADGAVAGEIPAIDAPDLVAPRFTPDGKLLVAGTTLVSVPDLQRHEIDGLTINAGGGTDAVTALSADGTRVARAGGVWDVASGRALKTAPSSSPSLPRVWVAFSPDGATYAESSDEASGIVTHLYRTSDWSLIAEHAVDFRPTGWDSSDGRFLFAGAGRQLVTTISPRYLAGSASDLPIARVHAVPDLAVQATIAEPWAFWAGPATFSPDGSLMVARLAISTGTWRATDLSPLARIAVDSQNYYFLGNGMMTMRMGRVYDPTDGREVGRDPLAWLGISPDGTLAVANRNAAVAIVRLSDLTTMTTLPMVGTASALNDWTFSRDNRFVVTSATDAQSAEALNVFDAATGAMVMSVAGGAPFAIESSGGSARLAGAAPGTGATGGLRVWRIPDGVALYDLPAAVAVDFSPDGSLVATTLDTAGWVGIYRADTGTLREQFFAHGEASENERGAPGVTSVAFSPTGQLATTGFDENIRLWCSH